MTFSDLLGKHILVVENDYHQASEIVLSLEDQGSEVVGPYPSGIEATTVVDRAALDGAVLSIQHRQLDDIFSLADRLLAKQIPIVFVAQSEQAGLPQRFQKMPLVKKTREGEHIIIALAVAIAKLASRH